MYVGKDNALRYHGYYLDWQLKRTGKDRWTLDIMDRYAGNAHTKFEIGAGPDSKVGRGYAGYPAAMIEKEAIAHLESFYKNGNLSGHQKAILQKRINEVKASCVKD